jgi:hypothetical protein
VRLPRPSILRLPVAGRPLPWRTCLTVHAPHRRLPAVTAPSRQFHPPLRACHQNPHYRAQPFHLVCVPPMRRWGGGCAPWTTTRSTCLASDPGCHARRPCRARRDGQRSSSIRPQSSICASNTSIMPPSPECSSALRFGATSCASSENMRVLFIAIRAMPAMGPSRWNWCSKCGCGAGGAIGGLCQILRAVNA